MRHRIRENRVKEYMGDRLMKTLTPVRVVLLAVLLVIIAAFFFFPVKEGAFERSGLDASVRTQTDEASSDGSTPDVTTRRMGLSGSPACPADAGIEGGILCNGFCANSQTDNNNCGICGEQCYCNGSFNFCTNCTNGACCISKGANCQYAPAALCCPGTTCTNTNTGTMTCQ